MSALLFSLLVAGRWAVAVVPVDPADGELAQNLSGVLEAQLTELSGAPVAAGEELRARLGLVSGRGILACVGDGECLLRVGRALAIEHMIIAIVSRGVGDEYILEMKLVLAADGTFSDSELRKPKGIDALIREARDVTTIFVRGRPAPELDIVLGHSPEKPPRRWPPLLVGGVGIALVGTGTILALSVGGDYDNLKKTCAPSCAQSSYSSLQSRANTGYVLIGIGAAAVAGGAIWYFMQPSGAPQSRRAWIAPSPNGLVVGGVF